MASDSHASIASFADLDFIVHCWQKLTLELPQHHAQPFGIPLESYLDQDLRVTAEQCLKRDDAQIWILKSDGNELLGSMAAILSSQSGFSQPNSGVLFNLWLIPEARGKGYGEILVLKAKEWLRFQGATSVQAGWHPSNLSADRFWTKQGFQAYETIAASML